MARTEWFTTDGGYVLFDVDPETGRPVVAVTAGDNDLGVRLEPVEALRIGRELLAHVLTLDEQAVLRGLLQIAEHRAR